MEVIGVME